VLCTERTCNSSIAIWTRICFCSAVEKWGTHRRCRTVKRSDCLRCRFRCTVDLGRQILRESSRTDENGNGNSARAVNIASSTGLRSTSGASEGGLPFGRKTEHCEHIWSPSSMPQRPSQACVQDRHEWHRESSLSSGDPEIEDDWLLVYEATDPKHPSFTSFFPKRGQGKALNSLSGFDCSPTFLELACLAQAAGMRRSLSHAVPCYT
jgi:hypothetical protein